MTGEYVDLLFKWVQSCSEQKLASLYFAATSSLPSGGGQACAFSLCFSLAAYRGESSQHQVVILL